MNKATSMLLSSILSTTVVTTSGKVYEDKYKTYMMNNLTQLEVILDGWKKGYDDLNTKLISAESRIKNLEEELTKTQTQISNLQNTSNNSDKESIKEEEKVEQEDEELNIIINEEEESNYTVEEVQESTDL